MINCDHSGDISFNTKYGNKYCEKCSGKLVPSISRTKFCSNCGVKREVATLVCPVTKVWWEFVVPPGHTTDFIV